MIANVNARPGQISGAGTMTNVQARERSLDSIDGPAIPRLSARDAEDGLVWGEDPFPVRLGPLEPLDDCPDCSGAVQRWARHSEDLGELWELPLSINTMTTPLAPLNRRGLREVAAIFTECARLRGEVAA